MSNDDIFRKILRLKKVPILTLDQKWHRLFAIHGKTDEIKEAEAVLNENLRLQGRYHSELKELRKKKAQYMKHVVQHMDDRDEAKHTTDAKREQKLEEDKQKLDEINEQIEQVEQELLEIPKRIKDANEDLMLLSMDYFYEKLRVNKVEAEELQQWIDNMRVELKKNIIKKQNRDINNKEIYMYLHDVFGSDVIDLFDIREEVKQEEEEKNEEKKENSFTGATIKLKTLSTKL